MSTFRRGAGSGGRLLAEQRRRLIAEHLRSKGSVTIAELEQLFAISAMTARRDLAELARIGSARRTHGGALSISYARYEGDYAARIETNTEAKTRIAKVAAQLVRAEDSLFLDGSSTCYFVARELLASDAELTIITNSLPILDLVFTMGTGNAAIVASGGELRRRSLSFVGADAVGTIHNRFADIAFLSVKGLTRDGYLTDADSLEAEVKRAMVERAATSVLAVDATKFQERGLNKICHLNEITMVVADDVGSFSATYTSFGGKVLAA